MIDWAFRIAEIGIGIWLFVGLINYLKIKAKEYEEKQDFIKRNCK